MIPGHEFEKSVNIYKKSVDRFTGKSIWNRPHSLPEMRIRDEGYSSYPECFWNQENIEAPEKPSIF